MPESSNSNNTPTAAYNVTLIGLGAMGGGMARALMESSVTKQIVGFDLATPLVTAFYEETKAAGKQPAQPPTSLADAVTHETDVVVLVLQTQPQCDAVCFGKSDDDHSLINLVKPGACVILCSTVTALWAKQARHKFHARGVQFVDCPISGGPVRARQGELTLMASGDEPSLQFANPILQALGKELHILPGGAGMGSTAKMVHQLLAGVHICVAAEALALAAKAGLNVPQMYDIVKGAAGNSWMFQDRGTRMMMSEQAEIKSQVQIFVKDLDIVYQEAKALQSPVPIATTALQQFISAVSLGLGKKDDSQVVKVYENVTGVSVAKHTETNPRPLKKSKTAKEGTQVGDLWKMDDGTYEEIVEVAMEPRHHLVLSNEYVRALRVSFPPNDTTLAHRHAEDSLYFFLVQGGLEVVNHVQGAAPQCDCMDFGEVRFGTHKSDKPLVHKITNRTSQTMLCVDAEVLKSPPVTNPLPLVADKHKLIKTREKCRVYQLELQPGESATVSYLFFHCSVVLQGGTIEKSLPSSAGMGPLKWEERLEPGDVAWKEPLVNITKTNVGSTPFIEFIAEWR